MDTKVTTIDIKESVESTPKRSIQQRNLFGELLDDEQVAADEVVYEKDLSAEYQNRFNQIIFKDFTEADFNIFFILCAVAKNQRARVIKIGFEQMRMFVEHDKNKKRFYKNIVDFAKKLNSLKAQKSQIDEEGYERFSAYTFFEKIIADERSCVLTIKVTESSIELINDLTSHFTKFEVREFCSINNKYAKNLYRLLKQYQATGRYVVKYNQFKEIMDIPDKYETCDIDKRILKPSIIKLTETNPYTNKPYFENLSYKKIKEKDGGEKGRGQGGSIERIEFSFTPVLFKKKEKRANNGLPPPPAQGQTEMKLKQGELVVSF